jgi:hypothetical protein
MNATHQDASFERSRLVLPAMLSSLVVVGMYLLGPTPAHAQQDSVSEVQKGRCPSGYTLQTNNNPRYSFCSQTTNQQVQQFSNPAYNPCVAPGQYLTSDEVPSGSLQGRDRCTVPGGIGAGPALPCPPTHPSLQIRQGQRDRCFRTVTEQVTQYANVQLFQ